MLLIQLNQWLSTIFSTAQISLSIDVKDLPKSDVISKLDLALAKLGPLIIPVNDPCKRILHPSEFFLSSGMPFSNWMLKFSKCVRTIFSTFSWTVLSFESSRMRLRLGSNASLFLFTCVLQRRSLSLKAGIWSIVATMSLCSPCMEDSIDSIRP